ncbi:Hypothetical predicted protein [Mytilus galloprovincialis]|nr:Hypothetical predicted protein [Mytilus galloprovincialis]
MDALHDEKMARQRLEMAVTQLHRQLLDKTENLTDLLTKCARRLEFESKMEIQRVENETEYQIQNLTRRNEELQEMYFELRQNHSQLQGEYEQLQNDLTIMKNDSVLMRKTINDLEPLKIVDALQHIKGLQMDTQTLKGNVNVLSMTQIARGQDFLALYNDTLSFKLNFTKYIEKQSRIFNETMVQILHKFQTENSTINHIEETTSQTITGLRTYLDEKVYNTSLKTFNEISSLNYEINSMKLRYLTDSRKVAITCCATASTVNRNTILKFANEKYSTGPIDINRFKTTGIFRCELAGLYIIALTVMTNHEGRVYVRRNGYTLIGVYVAPIEYGNYHTGSGFVTIYLGTGDYVTVVADLQLHIYGHFEESCLTIVKID